MIKGNRPAGRATALFLALLLLAAADAMAQFAGPGGFGGMGGYGSMQPGMTVPGLDAIGFRPWLSLTGTYSTNIPYLKGENVNLITDSYGGAATAGIGGGHGWSRTVMSGFLNAGYTRVRSTEHTEGMTAFASLALMHQISSRVSFSAAGIFGSSFGGYGTGSGYTSYGLGGLLGAQAIRQYGSLGDGAFNDPASNSVVDNELFANRTSYGGTFVSMRYQASRRWQLGISGTAYLVGRKHAALTDMQAYSGSGTASYRTTPRTYFTMGYVYSQLAYPKYFGGIRINQAYLGWGIQPNDRSRFSIYAGASQLNSKYLGKVALDPAIAELLGVSAVMEVQALKRNGIVGGAEYIYDWRRFGVMLDYNHNIMPGNGVLFAAEYDRANASLSFGVTERLSLVAAVTFNRSTDQIIQGATSQLSNGGIYASYRLGRGFSFFGGGGYSRSILPNASHHGRYASFGVMWSPGNEPIRF